MITMNEVNKNFNEVFEREDTLYVPDKYKNKSSHTPYDEANFYIDQVRKLKVSTQSFI